MLKFTVRIELRGSPPAHTYATLHREMEAAGFSRTIQGDNGTLYWLPHGEYDFVPLVFMSPETARFYAATVVEKVWNTYQILVSRTDYRAWQGLDVVSVPSTLLFSR